MDQTEILKRLESCNRPPEETLRRLPLEEQQAWVTCFRAFAEEIETGLKSLPADVTPGSLLEGALANMFVIAHEYVRFYGPIWK